MHRRYLLTITGALGGLFIAFSLISVSPQTSALLSQSDDEGVVLLNYAPGHSKTFGSTPLFVHAAMRIIVALGSFWALIALLSSVQRVFVYWSYSYNRGPPWTPAFVIIKT